MPPQVSSCPILVPAEGPLAGCPTEQSCGGPVQLNAFLFPLLSPHCLT